MRMAIVVFNGFPFHKCHEWLLAILVITTIRESLKAQKPKKIDNLKKLVKQKLSIGQFESKLKGRNIWH